jgi:RNA polymerase sigma factor (sigma-70 family)
LLLASRFELHDLADVEQLCTRAARKWCERSGTRLSHTDFDDLASFLVAAVWRMAERYDPERSSSFEAIVRNRLGNRCTDWLRSHAGRTRWQFGDHTYERELPRPVSLDAPTSADGGSIADGVGALDRDLERLGLDSFGGLLDEREREAVFDVALVRAHARRLTREAS